MRKEVLKPKGWLSDADYDFIYSNSPRLCVDLVVMTSQGVILTLRDIEPYKNCWHVPGGKVRWRESIIDAINRIAKAELNIEVEVVKMVGFMEFLREKQNKSLRHTVSIVFLVKPLGDKLKNCWQSKKIYYFKKVPGKVHAVHAKFLLENKFIK